MDSNLLHKESDEARRQLDQLEGAESSESESEGEEDREADKQEVHTSTCIGINVTGWSYFNDNAYFWPPSDNACVYVHIHVGPMSCYPLQLLRALIDSIPYDFRA